MGKVTLKTTIHKLTLRSYTGTKMPGNSISTALKNKTGTEVPAVVLGIRVNEL